MQVEQVDFITVPTRDVTRAIAFYRDVLGLQESQLNEGELESPNVTIAFWNPDADGEDFVPNVGGFALRVRDVAEAVEEIRAAGAEILGVEDTGVCHMGFVKDPDGNTVILHRRYAPRAG